MNKTILLRPNTLVFSKKTKAYSLFRNPSKSKLSYIFIGSRSLNYYSDFSTSSKNSRIDPSDKKDPDTDTINPAQPKDRESLETPLKYASAPRKDSISEATNHSGDHKKDPFQKFNFSKQELLRELSEKTKGMTFQKLRSFQHEANKLKALFKKRLDVLYNYKLSESLKNPVSFVKNASKTINEATGYSEIERLKKDIELKSREFQEAKESLKNSKEQYRICVETRAKGQRDINNLLQRKHSWVDEDVNLFTKLYRDEHHNEQLEQQTKDETKRWEDLVEIRYDHLVAAIRTRYHEEQLWSDKIRGASTYWTLALILLNTLMFLSVHTIFEPRRRSMLVDKVQENFTKTWEEGQIQIRDLISNLNTNIELQNTQTHEVIQRLNNLESQSLEAKGTQKDADIALNLIASLLEEPLNPPTTDPLSGVGQNVAPVQRLAPPGYSDFQFGALAFASATFGALLSAGLVLSFGR
ncbi:sensitivity to high expression protein she9 [Entomophthora muscae]|uniref:Sensitivity to high expression protein she9 n=1 Tax=Entomophthora muscae TaxID=34485 RepID=A0ACC2TQF6_9FUNG|nr:sensitivity to high expression protein she9 [Entomophthora muscae]